MKRRSFLSSAVAAPIAESKAPYSREPWDTGTTFSIEAPRDIQAGDFVPSFMAPAGVALRNAKRGEALELRYWTSD